MLKIERLIKVSNKTMNRSSIEEPMPIWLTTTCPKTPYPDFGRLWVQKWYGPSCENAGWLRGPAADLGHKQKYGLTDIKMAALCCISGLPVAKWAPLLETAHRWFIMGTHPELYLLLLSIPFQGRLSFKYIMGGSEEVAAAQIAKDAFLAKEL